MYLGIIPQAFENNNFGFLCRALGGSALRPCAGGQKRRKHSQLDHSRALPRLRTDAREDINPARAGSTKSNSLALPMSLRLLRESQLDLVAAHCVLQSERLVFLWHDRKINVSRNRRRSQPLRQTLFTELRFRGRAILVRGSRMRSAAPDP